MKNVLVVILLAAESLTAQTIRFNVLQDENWESSSCTNVEIVSDGYIVAGSNSIDGSSGSYIQKWNFDGTSNSVLYQHPSQLLTNYSESMNVVEDGIIFGWKRSSATAAKLSEEGEVIWFLEIDDDLALTTEFVSSALVSDGGYLFVGRKTYNTDEDNHPEHGTVYLVKTTSDGEILWESEFVMFEDQFNRINRAHELASGDFLLSGATYYDWDHVVIRIDSEGNQMSSLRWGDEEHSDWITWSVLDEVNGKLVLGGQRGYGEDEVTSFNRFSLALYEYDIEENFVELVYDHETITTYMYTTDFVGTPDEGYALLGLRSADTVVNSFILKFDSNYNLEWEQDYIYLEEEYTYGELYDFEITEDGGFICAGKARSSTTSFPQQTWLLKLDECGYEEWQGCGPDANVEELEERTLSAYPNPSKDKLRIDSELEFESVEVYSPQGILIMQRAYVLNNELDVSTLTTGSYFLLLKKEGATIGQLQFIKM